MVARPEYLIQRVAMHFAVKCGDDSEQHSDDLELHVVIAFGGAVTNSLYDRVYESALRSSFIWLGFLRVVTIPV